MIKDNQILDEIRAISFFSSSLYEKETIEEVFWDITKNVIHKLRFVDCVIYTYDSKNHVLKQQAAYGTKSPQTRQIYNRISLELGEGIVGNVAITGKAEIIKDTSKDPRYIIDDAPRYSEICVPIMINNTLFGIIDSEHPEKDFFTKNHLHLLTIVAALCEHKIKTINTQKRKPFTKTNRYFKRLEELMTFKKLYRNPHLSLSSTAEVLGISACYLSSIINGLLNKSFIDFINEYRIDDVKQNLNSMAFANYTVVSIGLEAGFNSKSAFYSAFKKHTGLTPMQYKTSL